MSIVVLAGGTGGAKLARGVASVVDDLVVVANTGDDIEIHGAHVSPDPDLVLFWLADRIDARGWGLEGDTFHAMDRLRARGEDVWFNLGDEDLEIGRDRLRRLRAGQRLTEALDALRGTLGVRARVLPMCDEPAPTFVDGVPFQEWMIRRGGAAGDVRSGGGTITPEVAAAIAVADAVIVGPSNPVISIGPILATGGMREALAEKLVVAVSPFVRGEIVKGPTAAFLPTLADAVDFYGDSVDAWVADERVDGRTTLVTDVLMADAAGRERLAREVLDFVKSLRT
jgi:LPPG:FO 2-phospho-L-lactate transferase